jgi:hypothetical protein
MLPPISKYAVFFIIGKRQISRFLLNQKFVYPSSIVASHSCTFVSLFIAYFWQIQTLPMRSFFKIFFASLLALIIFSLILFFVIAGAIKGLAEKDKPGRQVCAGN